MKLKDLEIFVVAPPAPGWGGRYWIFTKLTTDDGIVGYGECYASTVGPKAMKAVIEDVFERHMLGENPENLELMYRRAYSSGFTQRPDPTVMGAFSGLEIACWDILGKARNRPVYALLGGKMNERIRSYTYLYPEPGKESAEFWVDADAAAEAALRFVNMGFTAVKFDPAGPYTIRGGHEPALSDISRSVLFCKRIREAVGDRADLLFGTHGQFTTPGAIRMGKALEPYNPLWYEEPCPPDNLLEFAEIARARQRAAGHGRADDDQGRIRHAAARGRGEDPAAGAGARGRHHGGQEDRGDGRDLQRRNGAASLCRAGGMGGQRAFRRLDPEPADRRNHRDRRRLPPEADQEHASNGKTAISCRPKPPVWASTLTRTWPAPIPTPAPACICRCRKRPATICTATGSKAARRARTDFPGRAGRAAGGGICVKFRDGFCAQKPAARPGGLADHHSGSHRHAVVKVDGVVVHHADAARGKAFADGPGVGGAVDAV